MCAEAELDLVYTATPRHWYLPVCLAAMRNGDFIEDYRLVQALRRGFTPDFDVYDAATWSAVTWLSEQSVAQCRRSIDFPDFTRGKWKSAAPIEL
jgi:hypothetical protein